MIKSNIDDLFMDWDDIKNIIDDLKEVMDGMNGGTPDLNEFKVSIARAIASLRAEKAARVDQISQASPKTCDESSRMRFVTNIANAKLREELQAILD